MNKRMTINTAISLLLLIYLIACNVVNFNSAQPTTTPEAKDFIVTSEDYPTDWRALPCESALCEDNEGSTYEQFFNPIAYEPGQFFQVVYRLDSVREAKEKFDLYQNGEYNKEMLDPAGTDYSTPTELLYISKVADQYYFACAQQFGLVCKLTARYKNYFVFMYFDMDNGQGYGLTYHEVEKILVGLDRQADSLLYH